MLNYRTRTPRGVGLTAIIVITSVASLVNAQGAASRRAPGQDPAGVDPDYLKQTDPTGEGAIDEVSAFMTYFYLRPRPDQFVQMYRSIAETLEFQVDANLPSLTVFFGQIMRQYPDRIADWSKELSKLPTSYLPTLYYSLGVSETEESRQALKELADIAKGPDERLIYRILGQGLPNALTKEVKTGADLDMLWGAFMATGDSRYVQRVIDTLGRNIPATSTGEAVVLGAAAEWSLRSNAWQHSRVLETCRAAIDTASPALAEELTKIVNETEELQKTKPCPEPKPEAKTK